MRGDDFNDDTYNIRIYYNNNILTTQITTTTYHYNNNNNNRRRQFGTTTLACKDLHPCDYLRGPSTPFEFTPEALDKERRQQFQPGSMACLSGKTKERFRKADLFQTPGKLEASMLGAINGFFVLPMVVLIYAIFLAFEFNPLQSNSTIEVTVKCTPLKFTCTSKYGCEIAPMGT